MLPDQGKPFFVIDRHISVGHILTTLCIVFGSIYYASTIESRLMSLEKQDVVIENRMERQEQVWTSRFNELAADRRADMAEIRASLTRIEQKVDLKADK